MICKYCGQFIEGDKRFCTNCGAAVQAPVQQPQGQMNPMQPPRQPFMPYTPVTNVKKKGISKKKTIFFWASKIAILLALGLFFLPFMKISLTEPGLGSFAKPVEMTGKELIFGIDDPDANAKSNLTNICVIIAGITAVISLLMTSSGMWLSGISSAMLFCFMRTADRSYTILDKPLRDYKGVFKLEFGPAFYVSLGVLILATVLAGIDQYKRKQIFESEQSYGYF